MGHWRDTHWGGGNRGAKKRFGPTYPPPLNLLQGKISKRSQFLGHVVGVLEGQVGAPLLVGACTTEPHALRNLDNTLDFVLFLTYIPPPQMGLTLGHLIPQSPS